MFKKGLATLVILLFFGLALSPSIYADNSKVSLDTTPEFDYDGYTPIQLVFLLINKLRYYEGIESEEDVLEIIESDAELSGIVEELKSYSCGCEDDTTEWSFPVICTFLVPFMMLSLFLYFIAGITVFGQIIGTIGGMFNCFWA